MRPAPYYQDEHATIYHGEFQDALPSLQGGSVDIIVADPPYPRKFQHLYFDMAAEAPRLLRRGGSLLSIVPHYALPEILAGVGKHLKYRWIISMWQEKGPHPRMAMGVEVIWKPVVWWVNEAWPQGRGFVVDGFHNEPPDKSRYKWEQHLTWAENCLRYAPNRSGGLCLDPMMGVGTSGVAALQKGFDYIGIEKDERYCELATKRLSEAPLTLETITP